LRIVRLPASCVEGRWSPSLIFVAGKSHAKAHAYSVTYFAPRRAEGLSLSGGASIRAMSYSSWASPLVNYRRFSPPHATKATRGSPSLESECV
jgi:hypothetical protein